MSVTESFVYLCTHSLCVVLTHACTCIGCVGVCARERAREIVHVCESVNEKMVLRAKLIPFEDYSNNFRFQIKHTFANLH